MLTRHTLAAPLIVFVALVAGMLMFLGSAGAAGAATGSASQTSVSQNTVGQNTVEDFEFASWTTQWNVGIEQTAGGKDRSYAEVTETIVPVFPQHDQNRGIVRSVPLDIAAGRMAVSDVDVRDADGNEVPFDSDVAGGELTVAIGDDEYVHGEQTYVLRYTLHDVIADLGNPEVQELYANLLPTTRVQPIETFSASVTLAPELAESVVGDASCYIGEVGSDASCEILADGLTYSVAPVAMPASETITINIGFSPGTVPELSLLDRIGWFPFLVAALAPLGLVISLVLLVLQWRRSRHTPGGVVVAQYEPRGDLPPQVAAQLMPAVATHAFSAGILHAAVHGALRIEETAPDSSSRRPGRSSDKVRDPELRRLDGAVGLPAIERRFVDEVLFRGADVTALSGNEEIGEAYTDFVKSTKNAAVDDGFIHTSEHAQRSKTLTLWVSTVSLLVAVAAFLVVLIVNGGGLIGLMAGMLGALGIVLVVSSFLPTKLRTPKGAEAHDHLRGLREYIKMSETDRIRMLQSAETAERIDDGDARVIEVYEQLLPYAVLFGLDRSWAKELQAHYESADTSPVWLHGYSPLLFAATISQVKHSATSAIPAAEGGGASASGFAGGGMAGGGMGGGSVGGR